MNAETLNLITRTITGFIFGLFFWAVYIYLPPKFFSVLLASIAFIIVVFEWKNFLDPRRYQFWLTLPLYPVLPFVLLMYLNHDPNYRVLLLVLFIVAFSFDTGSYLVGRLIGRHKICPSVSPNKTWEGFAGGFVFACIGMQFSLWEKGCMKPILLVVAVTICFCVTLLVGDLIESWLKRRADIKDSGDMLPGHGGFLDRFDGILFTTYFVFAFKDTLMRLFFC